MTVKKTPPLMVGIGASAGGLEALEALFKAMPDKSNMAFIVVVHLDPSHVSMLPELLQRQTKIEVLKISDGMAIVANKIYVIPPSNKLSVLNGELHLTEPLQLRAKLPIDYFFKSLAQDQGPNAVGIVLSGTGSDGALGLQDIKAESGRVIVQTVESAKYDGMPKSAIATGLADYVLEPKEMPARLTLYSNEAAGLSLVQSQSDELISSTLNKILVLIRTHTGHDFSLYKKNTIYRRIERRMHVNQQSRIEKYFEFIKKNEQEIRTLFQELLIGVTSFFRDKEAFKILQNKILPEMLKSRPDNYTFRVWVAGCSSGEEAYTIAIVIQECLINIGKPMNVQVFGTDIDESAIERARSGRYPEAISDELGAAYCERYFIKIDGQYQVKKSIRQTLVFATQNLVKDPPFTNIDLVCCRNLLIYFTTELQNKVLPIFNYSLQSDGVLFLGPSETIGHSSPYFKSINKKWKIFRRKQQKNVASPAMPYSKPMSLPMMIDDDEPNKTASISDLEKLSSIQLVESILKQSDIAPCAVIDEQSNVIYVHGRLGQYLEPAEGRGLSNILEMARTAELKNELTHSIRKVVLHKKTITTRAFPTQDSGSNIVLDIIVKPLDNIGNLGGLMMVSFVEQAPALKNAVATTKKGSTGKGDGDKLRQELDSTRESLQSTIEELETSNEELKSSNEELQSTNEELQSTNEELETSKEELQSLNEESVTVNSELQSRFDQLTATNDDIKNLLDSTQIATLFLDTSLKVRRFTPKMTDIINLVSSDINRPIAHLTTKLDNVKIVDHATEVLKTLEKYESEVHDDEGGQYRMVALPYRTLTNVIDGVVISFENITLLKEKEAAVRITEQRYKSLFDHCPVTILEVDGTVLVNYINQKKITSIDKLDVAWAVLTKQKLAPYFVPLNINESALLLFEVSTKESLLSSLPKLINLEDIIYQQLRMIIELNESSTFNTTIKTFKEKNLQTEFTVTIPTVENKLNFSNTIIVISVL